MNVQNFSNEILNAAANAMQEYQNEMVQLHEQASSEPYMEVAQCYLMEKLDMSQSEAEEVCNELQTGITEFKARFQANIADDKVNLRENLQQATAEMDDQKRVEFLSSVLTAFQSSQLTGVTAEQIAELQKDNAKRPVVELIDEIEQLFNGEITFENLASYINANLNADVIVKLSQQIGQNKDEYRLLSALMLYVAQKENKVTLSDTGEQLPATLIGSLACASAELITATADLKEGKISLKFWQKILKYILGALAWCALMAVALMGIMSVFGPIAMCIITVFGAGLIPVLAALVVIVLGGAAFIDPAVNSVDYFLDLLSDIYDQYIDPLCQKAQHWGEVLKEWGKSLWGKKEEVETEQEAEPVIHTEAENLVTVSPTILTV